MKRLILAAMVVMVVGCRCDNGLPDFKPEQCHQYRVDKKIDCGAAEEIRGLYLADYDDDYNDLYHSAKKECAISTWRVVKCEALRECCEDCED